MGTLYEQIDSLCTARGISVGKMCADTALSRGNLTDLKMGRIKSLSTEALNKISRYFGVTVDFLLTGHTSPPASPDGEVGFDDFTYALWQETRRLSQTQKQALLGMARFFKSELDREASASENEQAKEAAD